MPCHPGLALVLSTALLATTPLLHAATVAHGGTVYLDATDADGMINDGAILDATTAAAPSSFNTNLVNNGPTEDGNDIASGAIRLFDVPVAVRGGKNFFGFILDLQETNNANGKPITITSITLDVATQSDLSDSIGIWSNSLPIRINGNLPTGLGGGGQSQTNTPLGAGGDMILLVPVDLFVAYTSDDYLNFRVTMNDSDNGDDEWALAPGMQFFAPGTQLPEPSSTFLLLLAGGGALLRRRR